MNSGAHIICENLQRMSDDYLGMSVLAIQLVTNTMTNVD